MQFPKLTGEQVAVLKAEGRTGHVITIDGELFNKHNNDEVYQIFENIAAARKYILELQKIKDEFEFIIFDSNEQMIEFIPF